MPPPIEEVDTILLVEDEDSVRKTFLEWLESAGLACHILIAADAEAALKLAHHHTIDLAILDWNLGAGNDGLQLLEDLSVFHPDIVAILVTGFANQATPLHAMRMGVRDYLDKNQDLDRLSFLKAVRKQLEHIRPAKRERRVHQTLVSFREAVEKILPLVQSANALNDPVPLPGAVASLFGFLLEITGAKDGVLLVRSYESERDSQEICQVYDAKGAALVGDWGPFARSIAGTVSSLQQPHTINGLADAARSGSFALQPFEKHHRSLLAAPLAVDSGIQVVFELFDKVGPGGEILPAGFSDSDKRLIAEAAQFGAALLRQSLFERQAHKVLFDAIETALKVSDSFAETLKRSPEHRIQEPPPDAVLDQIRQGLARTTSRPHANEELLELAEAIRVLSLRHGPAGLKHCLQIVKTTRELLDRVTGAGDDSIP
jgi:ActR/RegA family two-component response regulator